MGIQCVEELNSNTGSLVLLLVAGFFFGCWFSRRTLAARKWGFLLDDESPRLI